MKTARRPPRRRCRSHSSGGLPPGERLSVQTQARETSPVGSPALPGRSGDVFDDVLTYDRPGFQGDIARERRDRLAVPGCVCERALYRVGAG